MATVPIPHTSHILSVSQLNREAARLLAQHFFSVWVEGEVSNLAIPASGHAYFSLKDSQAQIRCALFALQRRRTAFPLENGQRIVVKGQVSLYEPRGDYQLIVEQVELAGEGELRRLFELLKAKLAQQGLFDASHKQGLPILPKAVGVITSPTGAAVRDILAVLKRRFPAVPVIIYPTAVQGLRAKYEIVAALTMANRQADCDVLILARGGGSLEDLMAFNEEMVAQAIFASKIPVISGVGHETDVTIADFVADLRAATPTAAAEHATPDQHVWLATFAKTEARLTQLMVQKLGYQRQRVAGLARHLLALHPRQKWRVNVQRIDELENRVCRAMKARLTGYAIALDGKAAQLQQCTPARRVTRQQQKLRDLENRLGQAMLNVLARRRQQLSNASQALHTLSPLATLNRGYAIASHYPSGELIRSTQWLKSGDMIGIRLAQGHFTSQIKDITHD